MLEIAPLTIPTNIPPNAINPFNAPLNPSVKLFPPVTELNNPNIVSLSVASGFITGSKFKLEINCIAISTPLFKPSINFIPSS